MSGARETRHRTHWLACANCGKPWEERFRNIWTEHGVPEQESLGCAYCGCSESKITYGEEP